MDIFKSLDNRLLRFAARFGTKKTSSFEIDLIINQLMEEGYFFDEFAHLEDKELNFEEKIPFVQKILHKLDWKHLSEEEEFRFLTGFYAQIGKQNDVLAYYAICKWMKDVGEWLDESYTKYYVGDRIGAHRIFGCYYSEGKSPGDDLIPSVGNPETENWDQIGEFRPTVVFSEWLNENPDYKAKYQPINIELLNKFR